MDLRLIFYNIVHTRMGSIDFLMRVQKQKLKCANMFRKNVESSKKKSKNKFLGTYQRKKKAEERRNSTSKEHQAQGSQGLEKQRHKEKKMNRKGE